MKKIILLFVLTSLKNYSQINSLDIKYGVTYNINAEDRMVDKEKLSKDHPQIYLEVLKSDSLIKNIEFKLLFDGTSSLMYGNEPKNENLKDLFYDFEGKDTIFTSVKTNEILIYKHDYWGVNLLIDYNYSNYDWDITNEIKVIDNMICYKAILFYLTEDLKNEYKFKVTAWFNPQIKTPIGPKGYGGLPGLIYELDDGYRTFFIKEIKINSNDSIINFDKNKKRIKKMNLEIFRKTFDEIKKDYKQMIMQK